MGHYTNWAFVRDRLGLDALRDLLSEQVTAYIDESAITDALETYVEAEIVRIDQLIDAAVVKHASVPVATTNPSFGMLQDVAEAIILRKLYAHSQQDSLPQKIVEGYSASVQTLQRIATGQYTIAENAATGPSTLGDSVFVFTEDVKDGESFHQDLSNVW